MQSSDLIPVLIVFIVVGIPVLAGTLISLAKIIKGESRPAKANKKDSRKSDEIDEAELMNSIYHGLTKLEKRIDSLETIIIEREKSTSQK